MTYVKLFGAILDSTLWGESLATRVVWITLLAMADRDGLVAAGPAGIAHRARVSREECDAALAVLAAPDPDSKSPEMDGRRILAVDGGWQIVTYERYRDRESQGERRQKDAMRQRRKYERDREKRALTGPHGPSRYLTPSDSDQAQNQSTLPPLPSHPSIDAGPPEPSPEGGREVGPPDREPELEPEQPDGQFDGAAELETVLVSGGWHAKQGAAVRRRRVRQLMAEGFTLEAWAALWPLAEQQGRDPKALLATWIDRGTWKDVLADAGLEAKERYTRARSNTVSGDDVGPIYGEDPRAMDDIVKRVVQKYERMALENKDKQSP